MIWTAAKTQVAAVLVPGLLLTFLACEKPEVVPDFVARVGTDLLLKSDVQEALSAVPPGRDSSEAVQQIVEQWVVNTLLEREARESGLLDDPSVQRLLQENERSVLVSAFIEQLYEDNPVEPTPEDIGRFFEVNKDRLRLRESYVQVRYVVSADRDSARTARRLLQQALRGSNADSLWLRIASQYSSDPDTSIALSSNYFAEGRLFGALPTVRDVVSRLGNRELSQVVQDGNRYHFVQVVGRVPPGTIPEIPWIESEISRQLVLEQRKQTVARAVQNLRNMAAARNLLEIRLAESTTVK